MQSGLGVLFPWFRNCVRCLKAGRGWVAAVIFATSIIACDASGREAQLVGSWQLSAGMGTITISYSDDHTFVMTDTTGFSGGLSSATGNWRVDGNHLITTDKTSTPNKNDIGKESEAEIVKIDNSVLILKERDKSGKEQMVTFTKAK